MTSVARTVVHPPSGATPTRARASPARHARARSRGRARRLASVVLGGLAGLLAAAVFVAIAPAVGRGGVDDVDRAAPGRDVGGRHPEPALPAVASVLAPAAIADAASTSVSAEPGP